MEAAILDGAGTPAFPAGNEWARLEEETKDVVVSFPQGMWEPSDLPVGMFCDFRFYRNCLQVIAAWTSFPVKINHSSFLL